MLKSGQVFKYSSLHTQNQLLQFVIRVWSISLTTHKYWVFWLKKVITQISICVSMLVFGQIQIILEIKICASTILGFQYRASTQLRYQCFGNRLDDEPRIGTPIRQGLIETVWSPATSITLGYRVMTQYYFLFRLKIHILVKRGVKRDHLVKAKSETCLNGLACLQIWILLLIQMLSGSQPKKQIQIVTAEDFLCFDGVGWRVGRACWNRLH